MGLYLVKSGLNLKKKYVYILQICVPYKSVYFMMFVLDDEYYCARLHRRKTLFPSVFTVVTLIFLAWLLSFFWQDTAPGSQG